MFCVLIFKTLGAGDPYNVDDFYNFGGLKSWGHVVDSFVIMSYEVGQMWA